LLHASLSKKNVTNILSDPLIKTTDASSAYSTHNLAQFDTIRKTSEIRAALAMVFPYPITTESRRKLQRFLDLPQLTIALLWHPLIAYWLTTYCPVGQSLSIAIDRSQWGCINLFTIARALAKKSHPIIRVAFTKLGNSNLQEQILALEQVIPLLKEYKVIVLGDREFCSVDAGILAMRQWVFFFRQKNPCLQTETLIWQRLNQLGLVPGTSLYFQGLRVRKTRPVAGFDIACKWKRNYHGVKVKKAWFILTDLRSLPLAIAAYKKRMGIEESYLDCKTGGYNIEGTGLRGNRLIKIILLMTLAYCAAIFEGHEIQKKQVQKYVSRRKEPIKNTVDGVHLALA